MSSNRNARFGLILAHVGDVIEDEEVVLVELGDGGFERQFLPRHLQALYEIGCARVQDAVAVFDERQADRGRQVAFASAWRADQDQVGALVEPAVAGDERGDVGLGDHGHDIEVEVGQGLAGRQLGLGQMAFEAPAGAFGDLLLGERGKESRCRPSFLVSALGEGLPDGFDGRQAQLGEHEIDLCGIDGAHEPLPARA